VENNGTDAVAGTFNGLAERATFTSHGDTFTISYIASGHGGGNDIELTVDSAPVPDPRRLGSRSRSVLQHIG
jgi:hypothetical protein